MLKLILLPLLLPVAVFSAPTWLLIRTTDGTQVEGQTQLKSIRITSGGHTADLKLGQMLSVHNGAPASDMEAARIKAGIAAILGADRKGRDLAVEELTAIGLPVMTPLLDAYKDTDQHEPRPLYRLFERIIPSYADDFDRGLSLVRMPNGEAMRGTLADATIDVKTASGESMKLPWARIRSFAVRQAAVHRSMQVHSLKHSTQIEFYDTGVVLTATSKVDSSARGLVRLSWATDSWASDADGLKKPGSPAYKSNMVDGQPFGALVGRTGADGEMFFLGKKSTKTGLKPGRLGLAVNDNKHWQNNLGTFFVTMTATDAYDLGDGQ
jgi:hypothetical protein